MVDMKKINNNPVSKRIQWGILGAAQIAREMVGPAIQETGNSAILAVASRDKAKAEAAAKMLGAQKAYGSYEELLADKEIEAVYIPLPNDLHKEWTIKAARQGKHVLCEKPLAMNVAECEAMVEECKANNVLLMEAFMYRFHPQQQRVKQLIAAGTIGEPKLFHSWHTMVMRNYNDIRMRAENGGGSLMDLCCYAINAARFVFEAEPTRVRAVGEFSPVNGIDTTLVATLEFPGNRVAVCAGSFDTIWSQGYAVQGTRGRIEVFRPYMARTEPVKIRVTAREDDQPMTGLHQILIEDNAVEETIPGANNYALEVSHLAQCLIEGGKPRWDGKDAVANMRVIEACLKAAKTNKTVEV
jgi:xylose dehydrogenase (NAD/NADP)